MLKIFKYLKLEEWVLIGITIILIAFQVWLDLEVPDYMREITILVQQEGSNVADIWIAGGKMLACALISFFAAIMCGYISAKVGASLSARLRAGVYGKVESFSMQEINKFSTASLITRSTNDITQIQTIFTMGMLVFVKAPILAIWAICKIAGKSWQWTTATAVAVALLLVMVTIIILFAVPKFKIIQKLTDNLNGVTRENLTGVRVVRAYNAEKYQEAKFEKANQELTKTNLFTTRIMAIMSPGITFIMSGLSLAIYWLGAYIVENATSVAVKQELFADMLVFTSYAMQVIMAFMMLVIFFALLPRAQVSAKRVEEVLETKANILDGDLKNLPKTKGEIEFKDVWFKYPESEGYVLKNISFKAKKGQKIAFIGSTGSGKSTLINLIPRFYDASKGTVLVDGEDVRNYSLKDLHNKIGYVSQKAVLFSGDIKSNITFGESEKPITESDIENAIEISQAKEFIEKKPERLSAVVAQRGTNLSGGQKQRVSIARAVARKPEIYIFDDSFSALDYKTDKKVREALYNANKEDSTVFIVAQRIGTIMHADKIIVIDNGEIVGEGTHDELIKNCQVYQEIALSQLSKEEL